MHFLIVVTEDYRIHIGHEILLTHIFKIKLLLQTGYKNKHVVSAYFWQCSFNPLQHDSNLRLAKEHKEAWVRHPPLTPNANLAAHSAPTYETDLDLVIALLCTPPRNNFT